MIVIDILPIILRPDTKGLKLPTYAETFPDKFMDPKVFRRARETATVEPSGSRVTILQDTRTAPNSSIKT